MTIRELMEMIHKDNVERGWWDGVLSAEHPNLFAFNELDRHVAIEKLMLIVSELAEALEEIREGHELVEVYFKGLAQHEPLIRREAKPLGFPTEIADAVIRLFDLAAACGIDLEAVIDQKLAYNRTRGHRHGGKVL